MTTITKTSGVSKSRTSSIGSGNKAQQSAKQGPQQSVGEQLGSKKPQQMEGMQPPTKDTTATTATNNNHNNQQKIKGNFEVTA